MVRPRYTSLKPCWAQPKPPFKHFTSLQTHAHTNTSVSLRTLQFPIATRTLALSVSSSILRPAAAARSSWSTQRRQPCYTWFGASRCTTQGPSGTAQERSSRTSFSPRNCPTLESNPTAAGSQSRVHLLDTEPFEDAFELKTKSKRPKLLAADYESLVQKADGSQDMDVSSVQHHQGDEEKFVLLDLNSVSGQLDIPSNAPYVLSGLDTFNPVLIIDDKLKLIGEYEEPIGTCLVFTEEDATLVVHEETVPSEANIFSGKCKIDPNGAPSKGVKPVARLHKILKFKLAPDADNQFVTSKQTEQV